MLRPHVDERTAGDARPARIEWDPIEDRTVPSPPLWKDLTMACALALLLWLMAGLMLLG